MGVSPKGTHMSKIKLSLPDRLANDIDRFVDQGEFVNREQAFEELLTMGLSAYQPVESTPEEEEHDLFTQAVEDQTDPAMQDDTGDEYTF